MIKGKKRERILRVLLNHPHESMTIYRLAKEAECSHPWVIEFLTSLEQKKIVKKTKVIDVEGVFTYWLEINKYPTHREYNVQDPLEILKETKLNYALTTYYAESLSQHYLFPSRVDVYVLEEDIQTWHTVITKEGLVGKGNFRILIDDNHIFYGNRMQKNIKIVSPPQLILDLLREQGVAVEAAQKLMKKEYYGTLQ
ncbi:MAG: hypothetical protein QCI00_02660 [Candidatus Thermoplasmatota archaeon]|nr:hypothetical protein [Candidatus Thermoplasmatota archaeon]